MEAQQTTLLTGDCLELMREMPDDSVDLVFCSPPYEAARTYDMNLVMRCMESFSLFKKRKSTYITTHPNNRKYFEGLGLSSGDYLHGVQVVFTPYVEERKTKVEWRPPQERFVEYEASDEEWLKALGMGSFVTVDLGPIFYEIERTIDPFGPISLTCFS